MKKIAISAIFTAALAIGMISAISTYVPSATADTFYCSDGQTFSAFNNIVVPEGQTCVLGQFNVVRGDIEVKQGASLIVCPDNDIAGSVTADGAKTVHLADVFTGPCMVTLSSGFNGDDTTGIEIHGKTAKVTICHKPGTADEEEKQVPPSAVKGHLGHGDTLGPCNVTPPLPPPKALGLVILGDVDIQNTDNFNLIGNTNGISIVRGDVIVQNTQTVEIIDVAGVANTGFGIGGDLEISTSGSCDVSGNVVAGNIELSGCSNLAN